jgi:glyoxylase-like metal-dependent hydrolase (beta-lactamase superfamily II)
MGLHHGHTRRDCFRRSVASVLAGASVFEEAFLRAGWARAQAQTASANLFTIEKVAEGVFAALAKPQALTNSNAAIFILDRDVLVVDAHSSLRQPRRCSLRSRRRSRRKPVRYLVNSHFHWDHTQGDAAYKTTNAKVEIITSDATKAADDAAPARPVEGIT